MKSRGLDHAPAGPIVACMSTFVYMVKVAPGTTGTEFEFFYAAASDASEALAIVRREVGDLPSLECDEKPLTALEAKRLGLSHGAAQLV